MALTWTSSTPPSAIVDLNRSTSSSETSMGSSKDQHSPVKPNRVMGASTAESTSGIVFGIIPPIPQYIIHLTHRS